MSLLCDSFVSPYFFVKQRQNSVRQKKSKYCRKGYKQNQEEKYESSTGKKQEDNFLET